MHSSFSSNFIVLPKNSKKVLQTPFIQFKKNYRVYGTPENYSTENTVLSGHSKIDKTKVLKKNGRLMKVESIAECSLGAFCNTFDLH